jgi:IS30 family transposase
MDTVHGLKSEDTKLLTFYHRQSHLQFGILIPNLKPNSISKVMKSLQKKLGIHYHLFFKCILAYNGIEFDDLITASIDDITGEVLSHVFYTRPYNASDKGGCERNHELFRYLVPKGHGLSDLMQEDINFMFSMINSYPRESLNWKTPIDVFIHHFPKDFLTILSIKKIPLDSINLKR